jgi:hypothetical protein
MLAEYPVAFECALDGYSTLGVIPCSNATVNVGNAMSTAGIFTVPFDGVYLFSFSASSNSDDTLTRVEIRVDASLMGGFRIWDRKTNGYPDDDELAGSSQVVARLKKGQKVDSFLANGYLTTMTRFVGHLLFPE